jgi:penicillin amidase
MKDSFTQRLQAIVTSRRVLTRALAILFILLLLIAGSASAWLYWQARASLPQLDGTLRVAGLAAPVEVRRDARGVPHIRAQSAEDLFFAQGYISAQDRLWQMDVSRRLATGELSEIFGERTLGLDIGNRTLGLRRIAERAAKELDEDSRRMFSAFARGVNAFIKSHDRRLPIEFTLLRYRARPWRETDSIGVALNMAKTLNTTWHDDLRRGRVCAQIAPELCADLYPDRSALDRPVAQTVPLTPAETRRAQVGLVPQSPTHDPLLKAFVSFPTETSAGVGSNNWVLSGAHTQSGKPLLANDPHLGHSVPSVWYMVHLQTPGINVTGVSLPGLPAVIIGHNQHIAWGVTNTGPDVQDLYIERFDPRDPKKYLHQGKWVDAEVRDEVIKIRGNEDYHLEVRSTRHGPIVSDHGQRNLALQWIPHLPRSFSFPFGKIDQARNWQEFVAALRSFGYPMQNFVYADVDGNIGYYAAGWVPIRKRGDGTIPVDGSTDDYDWTGCVPFEDLPHTYNPVSGLLATANGRVVPNDYPYLISREWDAPYRTARIYQLLEAGSRHALADMLRIQSDIYALYDQWLAQQVVVAAQKRAPQSPEAQHALGALRDWGGEARASSPAPLICQVTHQALLERLLRPRLGDDLTDYSSPMSLVFVQNVVRNNWTRWLPPGDDDFDATLVKSLEAGVSRIPRIVGSTDPAAWRWGDTIPLTFHHPLGGLPLLGRLLNVGPFPQAGNGITVKQTTPSIGPSMRMVVDLADLDNSVQNITLGQSGQILSPYYRDQFEAWYEGKSFPMLFSDSAIEKGTRHRLVLEPGG